MRTANFALLFLSFASSLAQAEQNIHVRGFIVNDGVSMEQIKQDIVRTLGLDSNLVTVTEDHLLKHAVDIYISTNNISIEDLQKRISDFPDVDLVFFTYTDSSLPIQRQVLADDGGCLNDGTLVNGSCVCKMYTEGARCEKRNCQRRGIFDTSGQFCKCPPGWYAQNCEIRGCRPAVADNLDYSKRSLIVVVPATDSMNNTRQVIINQLKTTVNSLQAQEPGWLGIFILELFYGDSKGNLNSYRFVTQDIDELIDKLKNVKTYLPNNSEATYQPVMKAIFDAQQFSSQMLPGSIVLAFTNTGDFDGGKVSYSIGDNTVELAAAQTMLLWRNRPFIFYIGNPSAALAASDNYDTYRRIAAFTLGELFITNEDELSLLFLTFLRRLYKPELLDSRTYGSCSALPLTFSRDYDSQTVTVMITLDSSNSSTSNSISLNSPNGTELSAYSVGGKWAMFAIPPGWTSATVGSNSPTCSAHAYISSKSALLWAYSDDEMIDVGNSQNMAENDMMATVLPVNMDPFYEIKLYAMQPQTFDLLDGPHYGVIRNNVDQCTYPRQFPGLPRCAAGLFTQKYVLSLNDGYKQIVRVYPGFCSHAGVSNATDLPPATMAPITATNGNCQTLNIDALNDPRMHDFRHVIFAVDVTSPMSGTINGLLSILSDVANGIQADSIVRQFSLITFDDQGLRVDSSTYSIDGVITALQPYQAILRPSTGLARSLDAVYKASKLSFLAPTIVHVFTSNLPAATSQNYVLSSLIQANIYYITSGDSTSAQQAFKFMQKQTSGRFLALSPTGISNSLAMLKTNLISSTFENAFVEDYDGDDCTTGISLDFPVDSDSSRISILATGNGILNSYSVTGGTTSVTYSAGNAVWLQADTTSANAGPWTFQGSTTSGGCSVQVRFISTLNSIMGFTTNVGNDFLAPLPFSRRGTNHSTYAAFRLSDSKSEVTDLTIGSTSVTVAGRNSDTCANNFISQEFMMPIIDLPRAVVKGVDGFGKPFQRLSYFYTPNSDKTVCQFPNVNEYGECVCEPGFTGQYCWDRICAHGGTLSNGICICASGCHGVFCELVVHELSNATQTPVNGSSSTIPYSSYPTTSSVTSTVTTTKDSAQLQIALTVIGFIFALCA